MRTYWRFAVMTGVTAILFAPSLTLADAVGANIAPIDAATREILEASGYQTGDLLTKSQVNSLLVELAAKRYAIPHARAILGRSVPDNSPLAKQFETPGGKKFLRKIGQIPGGYARIERLAALPQGGQLIRQLQSDPGGDKLIEYLATTASGRRLGSMTAKGPHGVNLNEPTDRIYTADDLIEAIKQAVRAESEPDSASGVKSLSP